MFSIPKNLKWFFLAGIVMALFLVDYLSRLENPFPRLRGGGTQRVAVLYIKGTPPASAGLAPADTLIAGVNRVLAAHARVHAISADSLRLARVVLQLPVSGPLEAASALQVAQYLGCPQFVVGDFSDSGDSSQITMRIIDASTGRLIGTANSGASSLHDISMICDSLASGIERGLSRR